MTAMIGTQTSAATTRAFTDPGGPYEAVVHVEEAPVTIDHGDTKRQQRN